MPRTAFTNLPHLAARLFGQPHMIAPSSLEAIVATLAPRLGVVVAVVPRADSSESDSRRREALHKDGEIAVIQVIGPLVQRAGLIGPDCGDITSYEALTQELEAALADSAVKGIVLELDSPGGEVSGLFGLVDRVANASKPVYAVANEAAYSAAYALASAADRIFVGRTAGVGSIGVVAMHVDQSAKNAKDGLKPTYVYAGDKKVDANPHEPLTDRARQDLQGEVDQLYELFVKSVADRRDMSQKAVRATEAGTFMGEEAVAADLADQVGTLEDAKAALRAEINRRAKVNFQQKAAVALVLAADASEDQILAAIEATLKSLTDVTAARDAATKNAAELVAEQAELQRVIKDLQAQIANSDAKHAIELTKTKLLEANLPPMTKDVEEDALALFALGKPELAKRTLERHLEGSRSKVATLRDPKVRLQKDEPPKDVKGSARREAEDEAIKAITGGRAKKNAAKR